MDAFKAYGGQVAQSQWVPVPCPDFAPYFATLKPADALVAWDAGSDAISLLTTYHQTGTDKKIPLIGAFQAGFLDTMVLTALPADVIASVVGIVTIMDYSPDSQDPANQAFVKAYTAVKPNLPDQGPAGPYQAVLIFAAAVNATNGDTTPATLLDAISKVKITGPKGPVSFSPGTTCATLNEYIVKVAQLGSQKFSYTTVYTYPSVPPTGYVKK